MKADLAFHRECPNVLIASSLPKIPGSIICSLVITTPPLAASSTPTPMLLLVRAYLVIICLPTAATTQSCITTATEIPQFLL